MNAHGTDSYPLFIIDIDGTVSDDAWRKQDIDLADPDPDSRYLAYHQGAALDLPMNLWIFKQIPHTARAVFITSRPESYRASTQAWIMNNLPPRFHASRMLMRPDDNHEPSAVLKPKLLKGLIDEGNEIVKAFDDRVDVLEEYARMGVPAVQRVTSSSVVTAQPNDDGVDPEKTYVNPDTDPRDDLEYYSGPDVDDAADILESMARTYRERNRRYRDNYKAVPRLVKALFPDGVPSELVTKEVWHLFELKLVKLTRFANSKLTAIDSIHDDGVYSAMIESIIRSGETK